MTNYNIANHLYYRLVMGSNSSDPGHMIDWAHNEVNVDHNETAQ